MPSFFGQIKILDIENIPPAKAEEEHSGGFVPLETGAVKFVHYSDCQQLIIWLPRPGNKYGELRLRDSGSGGIVDAWAVAEKLSGSVQVLWDTLPVQPGRYRIEIDHPDSGMHCIDFIKYEEGTIMPEETVEMQQPVTAGDPVIYRDGYGNIIEDEDLQLRENLLKEIAGRFSRHIEYESSGRSGAVIYVEGETRIPFYYEFGGGNCVAYIEIPSADKWEKETNMSLDRREDIIQFTAATVHARQAPHCRMEISDKAILYFRK